MTLTDREKFIYYATAIAKDTKVMEWMHDKRTVLLGLIREQYCAKVTNQEWHEIFKDCEQLRDTITTDVFDDIMSGYTKNEIANMFRNFITKGKLL